MFPLPQGVVWRENTVSYCQPEKFPKREPGIQDILTQPFHSFNHLRTQRKIHVKQVSVNSDRRQTYGILLPAHAPHSPAFTVLQWCLRTNLTEIPLRPWYSVNNNSMQLYSLFLPHCPYAIRNKSLVQTIF